MDLANINMNIKAVFLAKRLRSIVRYQLLH